MLSARKFNCNFKEIMKGVYRLVIQVTILTWRQLKVWCKG